MTALRHVFGAVLGWTALVLLLALGLIALTTAVESRASALPALLAALLRGPGIVVPLLPALVGLGSGLAAARMELRGERAALQACGQGPLATGRGAAVAGVFAALLGLLVQGWMVWPAEELARGLVPVERSDWVLIDGLALRPADGTALRVSGGQIERFPSGEIDPALFLEARELEHPSESRLPLLWRRGAALGSGEVQRRELYGRAGRVVQAALIAWIGWLPLGRSPGAQVGLSLLLGLGLSAVDLLTGALSLQGRLDGLLAAFLPVVALSFLFCLVAIRRG